MSMDRNKISGSFFPGSKAIITGGTFNIHNSHVHPAGKGGYERLLDAVAPNALHNSGHLFDPPKCHPGTRIAVIKAIMEWLAGADEVTRDKGVNWLTGAAGAGKSAIGRSVCELCALEQTLLASFFFGSTDGTRNSSKHLVSTIAYQICGINQAIRKAVSDFIDYDPLIFNKSLRTQFVSLVIEPLSSFYANSPQTLPRLIVIDGLDECLEESTQRDILETINYLLATYAHLPIRFLVCSRAESNIKSVIHGVQMNGAVFEIFLGDEYHPDEDIELYLRDNFKEIRGGHIFKSSLPVGWPSKETMETLVDKASGQFIYVSTTIRHIKSPRHRPHQRLDAILGLRPPFKDLPFAELDALYTHLIMMTEDPFLTCRIMAVLAMYPFQCSSDIEKLLQLEDGEVELVASDLAAIVQTAQMDFGDNTDVFIAVDLLHKSFEDFLFDKQRSKDLYINFEETRAWHILRSIEIFSEHHEGCRFKSVGISAGPVSCDDLEEDGRFNFVKCSDSMQMAVVNALAEFPIELFCRELFFSHPGLGTTPRVCGEVAFVQFFFGLLLALESQHQHLKYTFHQFVHSFCKCALEQLLNEDTDDLEKNFLFANNFLKASRRDITISQRNTYAAEALDMFGHEETSKLRDISISLVTKSEQSYIASRAALYCLVFLCDNKRTKAEAKRHLKVGSKMDTKRRHNYPWQWHRKIPSQLIDRNTKKLVLLGDIFTQRNVFSTYAKLPRLEKILFFPIHSFVSRDWASQDLDWGSGPIDETQDWFRYMAYLEYLPVILPLAGQYPPLIQMCKTKGFAAMSMMFPTLSRRARRSIHDYLGRLGSDDEIEGLNTSH